MEQSELNLKEIIQLMWRGKYFIAAVTAAVALLTALYCYFLITPLFQSSARVDLSAYNVPIQEIAERPDLPALLEDALKELEGKHGPLADPVLITPASKGNYIDIEAVCPSSEAATDAARHTALFLLQLARQTKLDKLNLDVARLERQVVYWDEQVDQYLTDSGIELTPLGAIPAYTELDPVYRRMLDEKGKSLVELTNLGFTITELEQNPDLDPEQLMQLRRTARPVAVNRRTYVALAGLFGMALAVFIVLLRYYWTVSPDTASDHRQPTPS